MGGTTDGTQPVDARANLNWHTAGLLETADERQLQNSTTGCTACQEDAPDRMGVWIRVLARLPLLHSLAWTLVFWGVFSPFSTEAVDMVLAAFMTYGMLKFVSTGVGAMYGTYVCHRNNSTDPKFWTAKAEASKLNHDPEALKFSAVVHVVVST
eukprot:SAG31_NODE_336_length_17493_cov_20.694032_8_plen_154_part_00